MIYDITRTLSKTSPVWPGDTPFEARQLWSLADGQSVNLFTLTLSPHTSTHADAFYHFVQDGETPAQMPLEPYLGTARVVTVAKADGPLVPDDFAHVDLNGTQRLLVHSPVSALDDTQWPETYPYLSPELVDWLADKGVILIGMDSPSMDALTSTDLPGHHALRRHNIANLEFLSLQDVPDGVYELIALPLKMDGVCGSPVRAVLRTQAP